jgi:transcriptional regulator with XRE-family HTH domain
VVYDAELGGWMPTIDAVKIGRRLRAERTKRFLTQAQLAQKAGISQKQLSKIENDEVEPRFSTILSLADALGVDPEIFLEGNV